MSWAELHDELRKLGGRAERDLAGTLRQLEIYQEEVERQNRELAETHRVLEESRDRYLELFESVPVGYLGLSPAGVIEEANPACAELLGRRQDVLVGVSLFSFVRNGEGLTTHLRRLAEGGDPVRDEVWLRRSDGAEVPVELFSRPSRGSVYRSAVMDLSERLREEEVRRELAVRERTAVEASRAKDRFIAMLSHELRTPLTPILASVAALETEDGLPPQVRSVIERIRRNVEAEAHLIDDLLDLTRVRRGQMRLDHRRVDGNAVVREALRAVGSGQRRVRLLLDAHSSSLWADPVRLSQIVANLIRNALNATRDSGEVRVRTENPAQDSLRISVHDSGVGIEPDRLARIFSAFESDDAPGRGTGGLGLGLAISKLLVEAHGGTIGAQSEGRGKGSCFTVELPLAEPELPLGEAKAPSPAARRAPQPERCILVVDDHEDSALSIAMLLERQGYAVRTAGSLTQALEEARKGFDAVVSDLALPDGSGHELLERLRRGDGRVRAIALSGFGAAEDVEASRRAGFHEHLTKPIDAARLYDALERVLAS